jgi:hypothetical protein
MNRRLVAVEGKVYAGLKYRQSPLSLPGNLLIADGKVPWTNPGMVEDVDVSGHVTAFDALLIISHINNPRVSDYLPLYAHVVDNFLDVSGDGWATAFAQTASRGSNSFNMSVASMSRTEADLRSDDSRRPWRVGGAPWRRCIGGLSMQLGGEYNASALLDEQLLSSQGDDPC